MTKGKAIRTNGIGKPCFTHLNRTRSLADVWKLTSEPERVRIQGTPEVRLPIKLAPAPKVAKRIIPPFAGYDRTERAL